MFYKQIGIVLVSLLLVAFSKTQEANKVHETILPNGLKVIVREDHRSPVVVSQLWYKVGSLDEVDGHTGISHALEHMMFKGTTKYKVGEFSRIIAENGGSENAFTARDYTVYFQQLEKSHLPISFELEADRMQNLLLQPQEFSKEIQVVMEERRMRTDDQPQALVAEKFMETAYHVNPYKNPIIGWMPDLKKMTADDVRAWYKRWYVPNNAILVVAGDVTPNEVFNLARHYFGPIPARPVERKTPPLEPPQTGLREAQVKAPAEVPYFMMGFHVPNMSTAIKSKKPWEAYALDVLSGILDGGNSARFARELVRGQQIAVSLDASYSATDRDPTIFAIDGSPATGHTVAELRAAVLKQIDAVTHAPVGADELKRVKAQVIASEVYDRDSSFGQAMMIGTLESVGLSWHLIDDYVNGIRAVTPAQVQAVARKYLVPENMTVVTLDPQPIDPNKKRAPAPEGMNHVR